MTASPLTHPGVGHAGSRAATIGGWRPIERPSAHDLVLAEIEKKLAAGDLQRGDRLPPERQLADALGVGRGVVREALRMLEALGVLKTSGVRRSAGFTVVADPVDGLAKVFEVHLQMSSFEARDVRETVSALQRLVEQQRAEAVAGPSAGPALAPALLAAMRRAVERSD